MELYTEFKVSLQPALQSYSACACALQVDRVRCKF